jgi:hypothetical protein
MSQLVAMGEMVGRACAIRLTSGSNAYRHRELQEQLDMSTRLNSAGVDDVAPAVVDVLKLIIDVEFTAADRRTSHASRLELMRALRDSRLADARTKACRIS